VELVSSEARRAAATEASTAAAVDYEDSESPRLPGEASGRVDDYEAASSVDLTKPVL